MAVRLIYVATAMALLAGPASAADTPQKADPIDQALDACMASPEGQSTRGMVDCTQTAITAWDKRLNATYQRAMKALDPSSQELLRTSQRRWVAFREAERTAMGGPWRQNAGTIANIEVSGSELSAIKERVSELSIYLSD